MNRLLLSLFVTVFIVFLGGCNSTSSTVKPAPIVKGPSATMYVFNISGATLFSQDQVVLNNGHSFVSIPREKYQVTKIAPGFHKFTLTFRVKPYVELNAKEGQTYYMVVGYNPAKSWAFPLGGDSVVLKQISKQEAQPLLKVFKHQ